MDQCKHCLAHGDIEKCLSVPCSYHDDLWYTKQIEWALIELFDANYGTDYHDLGNGDGISSDNARKIETIIKSIYKKRKEE